MIVDSSSGRDEKPSTTTKWKEVVVKYQQPALHKSLWQLANTLIPYGALWYLMYLSLSMSYWLTAAFVLLAAGFLVRVFIISHDCGHGSFFRSRTANDVVGFITGVLSFTPYFHWRREHALHHSSAGDLDHRGTGDIWTLTVEEYLAAPLRKRFLYRIARNPFILFVVSPAFLFMVKQRFPSPGVPRRERNSVYWTNLGILVLGGGLSYMVGIKEYLMLQASIFMVAGTVGVWLFYVQHQFEGVYWQREEKWDYCAAALQGSSFYRLPKILQWFSGSIGFHHIHHLSPRIPNYNLEKCHRAEPLFQTVKPVTFFASFKALTFRLWDEQRRRLVSFRALKNRSPGTLSLGRGNTPSSGAGS